MPERGARPEVARLFIALWPDDATRGALAAWRDMWVWPPGVAPVATPRLHLTLHFIGPVPVTRVPEVAAGLAVSCDGFVLDRGRPGRWRGIAAWCPDAVPPALRALHRSLALALHRLALPVEARPFRPHVTLARKAGHSLPPPQPAPLIWAVSGYALVQSQDGYRLLRRYP